MKTTSRTNKKGELVAVETDRHNWHYLRLISQNGYQTNTLMISEENAMMIIIALIDHFDYFGLLPQNE